MRRSFWNTPRLNYFGTLLLVLSTCLQVAPTAHRDLFRADRAIGSPFAEHLGSPETHRFDTFEVVSESVEEESDPAGAHERGVARDTAPAPTLRRANNSTLFERLKGTAEARGPPTW
ncbi:MAG: hypothetical protein AAGK22_26065 [Acidobacteriota bacterium]